jgi:hypothetical protein
VVTAAEVKVEAAKKFPQFWQVFNNWVAKKKVPAAEPQQEPQQEPQPEVKEPEVVGGPTPFDDAPQPDQAEIKKQITEIQTLAIKKKVDGEVMKQFKVNSWDDFLALDPDMIPTLRKFVEEAPQK